MTTNQTRNRISLSQFEAIRDRFGWCASWALWAPVQVKPKSGIGDLRHFESLALSSTLRLLHANVIFIGLNISRDDHNRKSFANFHSENPSGQDYKLRYALQGTPFIGAYMTDIIKGFEEVSSAKLMTALRNDPALEPDNIKVFLEELDLLQARDPILVALGGAAHRILTRNFSSKFRIVRVPHYAHQISPPTYRKQVLDALLRQA